MMVHAGCCPKGLVGLGSRTIPNRMVQPVVQQGASGLQMHHLLDRCTMHKAKDARIPSGAHWGQGRDVQLEQGQNQQMKQGEEVCRLQMQHHLLVRRFCHQPAANRQEHCLLFFKKWKKGKAG